MNDKEFYETLGAILRNERKKRHMTLSDIADRIGVTPAAVHFWETGQKAMSALSLSKYCDILNMSIDDIFDKVKGL